MCPFHFCGEASAAELPGIPGMASAETDLYRGQHWKQGTEAQGKDTFGKKSRRDVKEIPLTAWIQKAGIR